MAPDTTADSAGEIEVCNLIHHHLTAREQKNLFIQVLRFSQVRSVRIVRGSLYVTIDTSQLAEDAHNRAAAVLVHRIAAQVERCKTPNRRVGLVRTYA